MSTGHKRFGIGIRHRAPFAPNKQTRDEDDYWGTPGRRLRKGRGEEEGDCWNTKPEDGNLLRERGRG